MTAPIVRAPEHLPDLRLWLRSQWAPQGVFSQAALQYLLSRSPEDHPRPETYRRWEDTALASATLWWVAEDMVDLLLACARDVPNDVRLSDLVRPSNSGLIVFAKPWWGIDAETNAREVQVDAMLWATTFLSGPVTHRTVPTDEVVGLGVSSYRRLDFDAGLLPDELGIAAATGAVAHAQATPEPDFSGASLHGTTWAPLGRSDWPEEDRLGQRPWDKIPTAMLASYLEDRRVIAALWSLLRQEGIASRIVRDPPRQTKRRTERSGIDRELAKVQVVRLRQPHRTDTEPGEPGAKRDWDHRWLVSGHWRWQAVGPGRSERRLTFVRPFIKGPADKPLHLPEKVNAWIR